MVLCVYIECVLCVCVLRVPFLLAAKPAESAALAGPVPPSAGKAVAEPTSSPDAGAKEDLLDTSLDG